MGQTLLKKRTFYADDNVLGFPNMDELLRARNTADHLVNQATKITKALAPYLHTPELTPITEKDAIIGVKEVARILGVSERTVGRYREEGLIASIGYNERCFRFRKADIVAFQNRKYRRPLDYCE